MEQDDYYQIDGLGIPFAGGGLSASLSRNKQYEHFRQARWRSGFLASSTFVSASLYAGRR